MCDFFSVCILVWIGGNILEKEWYIKWWFEVNVTFLKRLQATKEDYFFLEKCELIYCSITFKKVVSLKLEASLKLAAHLNMLGKHFSVIQLCLCSTFCLFLCVLHGVQLYNQGVWSHKRLDGCKEVYLWWLQSTSGS